MSGSRESDLSSVPPRPTNGNWAVRNKVRGGQLWGKPRRSSVAGERRDRGREPPLAASQSPRSRLPSRVKIRDEETHILARDVLSWRFPRQLRVDRYREECSAILTTTAISHCCSPAMRPVACGR